ncbi:hypothetical protein [Acidianus ambivalens]|uniref:Uncharacterized protein n=1 Tax=Acidianus ambivalens TaxID=2283 RepID=A0A650CRW1_ACIAM|nr:hypothetical protein [Acidianus ambivalens]MQL55045.1 hypothetical protein [Acidianus ambivalens]QGR20601.1 hypothetical protein D1866_00150 [Acidianus ambivalens]
MALELENLERRYLDEKGFRIYERPTNGYEIAFRYIPINSVKEIIVYKIENGKETQIAQFSSLDNPLDVAKSLEEYPQGLTQEVLQLLK